MNRIFRLILILFLLFQTGYSGEYADSFLELGVSARALAMSNTLGSLDFSGTSFFSNPAGLSYLKNKYIGLMYTSQFGLANHNYFGIAIPISKNSSAALSWIRFGVDDIPIRPDILRQIPDQEMRKDSVAILASLPLKTFQDTENAIFFSYGRFTSKVINLGWRYSKFIVEIPFGINFKIIHKKLYNLEAYGLGVDIGSRLRVNGEEIFDIRNLGNLSVGLSIRDVAGTTIYWNTKRQDVIRVGPVFSFALEQPFKKWHMHLNIGMEKEYRYDDKFRYGAEIILYDQINLRTGLNKSGLTFGLGLNFKALKRLFCIDYAFLNHDLGASHRIGGGITL